MNGKYEIFGSVEVTCHNALDGGRFSFCRTATPKIVIQNNVAVIILKNSGIHYAI